MSTAFQPGQRFLSEAEPELGLGLVTAVEARQVELAFPLLEETRRYVVDNAPLLRLQLNPGDTATTVHGWAMEIETVAAQDRLLVYHGIRVDTREVVELPEPLLTANYSLNQPRERLLAGQTGRNRDFELRLDAVRRLDTAHRSSHLGLHGPRVELLPHQLYVADQVSRRHQPRVLLADEVGLGKTIEAGLIIHRQLLTNRARRVLILVPDALQHQWLIELRRRFNLLFTLVTPESEDAFETGQLLLCPLSVLLSEAALAEQAYAAAWDTLVVDEAHHLTWSRAEASPAYSLVERLASAVPSVLLLTATPEQLGPEGHFARLKLLDPERFHDLDAHLDSDQAYREVADSAAPLLEQSTPLTPAQLATLSAYLEADPQRTLLQPDMDSDARRRVLDTLIDRHGTGRVLFRNTRHSVGGMPKRSLRMYALPPLAPGEVRTEVLSHWLLHTLRANPDTRYLLICEHDDTALDIATALRLRAGIVAAVFHSGMSVLECDRAAAHFADDESGCPILISSAVGSEGRNFQFVHDLILFDLPHAPDVLEQRIGRVDRIGQKRDVVIHVPCCASSADEVLLRWYDEGLGAFARSCNYGSAVLSELGEARALAMQAPDDTATCDRLIAATRSITERVRAQLDAGRDRLLELASTDPVASLELATELQQLDNQPGPWPFIERAADCFGLELEELSADSYSIHIGSASEHNDFPGLPEDGCSGTDNRELALHREDLEFITWEHPLVRGLLHLVVDGDTGKTAAVALKAQPFKPGEVLLETVYSLQSAAPGDRWQRYLPVTYLRLLHTRNGLEVASKVPSTWLAINVKNIDRGTARQLIDAQRATLANRMVEIEQAAADKAKPIAAEAVAEASTHFASERDRLVALRALGAPVRDAEITALEVEQQQITTCLDKLTPQLESVRVIFTH
ncbi:MAG: helicase-related protein [Pseudomonadota bacterium]